MNELALASIIISAIALLASVCALGVCLGMKWSSHKIEWKPLEINDPFKEDNKELHPFSEPDSDLVEEAMRLSSEGRKKKKEEKDPLDEILESNNF